ncbi:regulator of G-protein signaling 6-like isoform X1 [Antedon mediterranea]|uniref:regulator of G-protein signaling 6-like isoform X1 n=1 Tax=Antedon mediterranea TaxID=105859 RepID=UPI003AF61AD8
MDLEQDYTPKPLVFGKMENLITDMQNVENGVPVGSQKTFLSVVPSAFTGYDFIEWLMERLGTQDCTESLHLANLLCQYGYIFPVQEMKTLVVRDDGTLYRFQSPYFWPSQNRNPDSTDYAVYLAKRNLSNKQKHSLEEYEVSALTKLKQMLSHKWEFVLLQAQEQIRIAKQRKKTDRLILNSQERAFWRVHRPPPGQINCLENGIRGAYTLRIACPLQRKNTVERYKKQICFLNMLLSRSKIKLSKAIPSSVKWCTQYMDHDPLISGAQPSNPWISDDPTMWILNNVLVDIPTERRVLRWSISLCDLLQDATGRHHFELFLKKEFSQENIRFWNAYEELKYAPQSMVAEKVKEIYEEFLAPCAPCEINVDRQTVQLTNQSLKKPNRFSFEAAQKHIFILMKKDSYPRFLKSEAYKNLLAMSSQCSGKKKLFGRFRPKITPVGTKRRGSSGSTESDSEPNGDMLVHSLSTGNLTDTNHALYMQQRKEDGVKNMTSWFHRKAASTKSYSPVSVRNPRFQSLQPIKPTKDNYLKPNYPLNVPDGNDVINTKLSEKHLIPKKSLITPWEDEA